MKVYEAETGVTHWVAASNLLEATEALVSLFRSDGLEDDIESLTIDELPPAKARAMVMVDEGSPTNKNTCWVMAQECKTPTVFACSEWP